MPVLRHRVVVGWWRIAGPMWIHLLAWVGFAGATAFAQGIASTNAPEKFANSDCLDCHLDPNTTRVVNGKTESLVFPTNDFAKIRPRQARLRRLPHRHQGTGPRRQLPPPDCAGLPRQGGQGLRHQHPRHEPRAGRLRRGQLLGLPRLARHSAGQRSGLARLQTEPAAAPAPNATATPASRRNTT